MSEVDLAEYNGSALVGTAIGLLAATYISVALRTYVRAVLTRNFQADDWLMLVGQATFTVSCVFILAGVQVGLGKHNKALKQEDEIEALKWQALATATYILSMMFIKLSIAIFLLRLAVERRYRWTLLGSMFVVAVWSTVLFFWNIFQCSPVQAQWEYTIPDLKCVTSEQIVSAAYALSVMTIITDWLYALLPIPMIWNVRMTKQAKATVVVLLGLGIFASVATLVRLTFLADLNDTEDILFAGTDAMVWTLIEPGVAIVASSIVTIRPLLHAMRIKGFMFTEDSDGAYYDDYGRSGGGTARSNRGNRPGFGPDDLALTDIHTGRPGQTPSIHSSKEGGYTSNDPDLSLPRVPPATKGPVFSGWEGQVDEAPLALNRG